MRMSLQSNVSPRLPMKRCATVWVKMPDWALDHSWHNTGDRYIELYHEAIDAAAGR